MTKKLHKKLSLRFISLLTLVIFMATLLPACGGGGEPTTSHVPTASAEPTTTAPTTSLPATRTTTKPLTTTTSSPPTTTSNIISGKLSEENLKVSGKGVSIEVSPVCLNEEAQVTIAPVENMLINNELAVVAYDFKIDTDEDLAGLMTLTIPYDKSQLKPGMDPSDYVGACYYNQALKVWEPVSYEIDSAAGNIIITTDHLSVYGGFVVGKEFTREAYVDFVLPGMAVHAAKYSGKVNDIINEAIANDMNPGPSALELGNDIVNDWLSFSNAGLTLLTNTIYATDFLDGLTGATTNLGLLSAFAQVAVDYQKGDSKALHTNLMKNLTYFAVSKFGNAALNLGSVGVFFIDYSLNKFATAAWTGRENIYTEAYRLYYLREAGVKRSAKDWYYILLPLARNAKNPEELEKKIMAEVDSYCWQFWDDALMVAHYQDQAQSGGFTGGGGLNQDMKDKISGRQKGDLLNDYLDPVFRQIGRKLAQENEDLIRAELQIIRKELNKVVTIEVYDSAYDEADPKPKESVYAGYIARIAPLDDQVTDKEKWEKVLDKEGKAKLPFRILGHIMAGAPNTIEIIDPKEDDEVVKEVTFIVAPPTVGVDIGDNLGINGIKFASSSSTVAQDRGVQAILSSLGTIPVSKEGNFTIDVPYNTTSFKSGRVNWTVSISGFVMTGQWDNAKQTGTVNVSFNAQLSSSEKASFALDPEMKESYALTKNDLMHAVEDCAGTLTVKDEQLIMVIDYRYQQTGTLILNQYRFYNDEWHAGTNPTVEDMYKSLKGTRTYRFDIS
jgi:hypothetical protein